MEAVDEHDHQRDLEIAAIAAVIGFCLMAFFLATGAMSPEPSDHPAWMEDGKDVARSRTLYLIVMLLCLPAFEVAGFVAHWGLAFWLVACVAQTVLFFVAVLRYCFS